MKVLKTACATIIVLVSVFLLMFIPACIVSWLLPELGMEETWFEALVPLFVLVSSVLLLIATIGVMRCKRYAWWFSQLLFISNMVLWIGNPYLMIPYLVWFIAFSFAPPWKWKDEIA